jgi:predicted secreted protein
MNTNNLKNIRTGISLVLLLTLLLASCAQPQPEQTKEVSISWSEIEQGVGLEVGDVLEVVLPANPSTGYAWEAGFYNQSVLEPYGEPEFSSGNPKPGAEESQILHFKAIGEGETDLVLVYRRSFENQSEDQQTFSLGVVVK